MASVEFRQQSSVKGFQSTSTFYAIPSLSTRTMGNREFVEYRGVRVIADWPEKIAAAQLVTEGTIAGVVVDRIQFALAAVT